MSALYHYCATYEINGVDHVASGVLTTIEPIASVEGYRSVLKQLAEFLKLKSESDFVMRSLSRLDA